MYKFTYLDETLKSRLNLDLAVSNGLHFKKKGDILQRSKFTLKSFVIHPPLHCLEDERPLKHM